MNNTLFIYKALRQFAHHLPMLVIALALFSSCGADRNFKKGEKYLALGEYFDAATEFKQAYTKTPAKERERRGQIALKMAASYDKSLRLSCPWSPAPENRQLQRGCTNLRDGARLYARQRPCPKWS